MNINRHFAKDHFSHLSKQGREIDAGMKRDGRKFTFDTVVDRRELTGNGRKGIERIHC